VSLRPGVSEGSLVIDSIGATMREDVITEADTCRGFVTPRLVEAGWSAAPHAIGEQRSFKHAAIRQANAALIPATLERVFAGNP
jgi:hypothetical protein